MSPRPNQRSSISDLRQRIITTAWQQIAAEGAPALSLRAIARSLNISAPAIYNYFPDRDGLVTALIVEAFNSLGDSQEKSIEMIPAGDHAARLRALGLDYRQWAITYPERYQLIFGTPVAGYQAPEETNLPAGRAMSALIDAIADSEAAGRLRLEQAPAFTPELESMLHGWRAGYSLNVSINALYLALVVWAQVHGLVSVEVGHQFPIFITDPGEIYRRELERMIGEMML